MRSVRLLPLLLALAGPAAAQGAGSYYDSVDTSSSAALRQTLHELIDDHVRLPYTSSATDTWDCLEAAQRDPANASRVILVYKNESVPAGGGYQREHTWPKSYGFPDDDGSNVPYTDCHLLMLSDGGYNSARSNKPFRTCTSSCTEYPTVGGSTGTYPGDSNWSSGSFTNGRWEVWHGRRGDIARAMFYAEVRYEGGSHGGTGALEPDLILTDDLALVAGGNTGQNEPVAYMGVLATLRAWHLEDPPDAFELQRNDTVQAFQGNRNPFVDHPEWVECLFDGTCDSGDPGAKYCSPAVANSTGQPASLTAVGSDVAADNDFRLLLAQLPLHSNGYVLVSSQNGFVFHPGGSQGNLCLSGDIGRGVGGVVFNSGFLGSAAVQADLTALPQPSGAVQVMPGETWYFQAWFRDSFMGQPTSNFSDGWEVTFQ